MLARFAFYAAVVATLTGSSTAASVTHEASMVEAQFDVPGPNDRPPGSQDPHLLRLLHGAILLFALDRCAPKYVAYEDIVWARYNQMFARLVPHGGQVDLGMEAEEEQRIKEQYPSYGQISVPIAADCAKLKLDGDAAWLDQLVDDIEANPQNFE